jgi:hypothetical protein
LLTISAGGWSGTNVPSKIVFIVGAGASAELGLPVGRTLIRQIASLLDLHYDAGRLTGPDHLLLDGLRSIAQAQNGNNFTPYLAAARHICEGVGMQPSIDTFIDSLRGDRYIEAAGKAAIVRAILMAEKASALWSDPHRPDIAPDVRKLSETWLARLWERLTDGCAVGDLEKRAESVAFIVFNYDRSIQHYLYHAAQRHYRIGGDQAEQFVQSFKFYHPYGSVGALPWKGKFPAVAYGGELDPPALAELSTQIKTFTEGANPSSDDLTAIRNAASSADRIVFLGYAFHPQNNALIWPQLHDDYFHLKRVLGTSFGISDHDIRNIRQELGRRIGEQPELLDLIPFKAFDFFHERGRALALE